MAKYQGFWDRIANTYAKTPIKNQQAFNEMVENIRKHVDKDDSVLDFGCGTGTYSIAIADKVNKILATDISQKMLAIAAARAEERGIENITFEQLEIFDSRLKPASFSAVLAFNILHLQQDLDKALSRIAELLQPGGLLISKSVCLGGSISPILFIMKPFSKLGLLPFVQRFTPAELQAAMQRNHLNVLETKDNYQGSHEYFIVARK